MKSRRTVDDYEVLEKLGKGNFVSSVSKVVKKPMEDDDSSSSDSDEAGQGHSVWYLKQCDTDYEDGVLEVLGQELFRLFIPGHPRTRLVLPSASKLEDKEYDYAVASKAVPDFCQFEDIERRGLAEAINNGHYQGLGEVLVLSLFTDENDLHFGNLGRDAKRRIIKIDGGWCFTSIVGNYDEESRKVTANDIASLPAVSDYQADNWLDQLGYEATRDTGEAEPRTRVYEHVAGSELLRREVNRALLKIILMPHRHLKTFVGHYVQDEELAIRVQTILHDRKDMLKNAALENASFQAYVVTDAAQKDAQEFVEHIREFKMTGRKTLKLPDHGRYMLRTLKVLANRFQSPVEVSQVPATLFAAGAKRKVDSESLLGALLRKLSS